ncbi:MAG: hypothetical protein PVJ60_04720 [Phycisphaerales bacterium]
MKIRVKSRFKKLAIWLLVDLAVLAILFAFLLYRPGRYKPTEHSSDNYRRGEVSPYLTNDLMPKIYNGAQRGEPFELIVTQDGLNDTINRLDWPVESEGVLLYNPAALIIQDTIVLMGTADAKGVEFIITIELEPEIDEQGLINLRVSKIKVGAMNITPLARMMAKKTYTQKVAAMPVDKSALRTKIVASLLNNEPFEPVFSIDDRKVRIDSITITEEKLLLLIVPSS